MNCPYSPTRAGIEQLPSGLPVPPPPPPPPLSISQPLSPRRRTGVVQPPPLTTSLGGLLHQGSGLGFGSGYYSTPNSTSSLSGPFSQSSHPGHAQIVGLSTRDTSPMALRYSAAHAVQYNPSEWRPTVVGSPQLGAGQGAPLQQTINLGRASPQAFTDETTTAPPPPYSPQPFGAGPRVNTSSTQDTVSPAWSTSQRNTPSSAATTVSPDIPLASRSRRPRPLSMIQSSDVNNVNRQSGYFPPPPPPPANSRPSRPSSQNPVDRLQNVPTLAALTNRNRHTAGPTLVDSLNTLPRDPAIQSHQMSQADSTALNMRPPASKRAASAGAVDTSNCSSVNSSRTGSRSPTRTSSWVPGMPLPGPPPIPPPAASRSQSTSGVTELSSRQLIDPAPRSRARQAPQIGTLLGPVPPTPAGWVDDQLGPSPNRSGSGLHIDTKNLFSKPNHEIQADTTVSPPVAISSTHSTAASGLFRSAARREPSAGGIRERRSASRHAFTDTSEEMSALSMSSNPWADALIVKPVNLDLATDQASGTVSGGDGVNPNSGRLSSGLPTEGSNRSTPRAGVKPLRLSIGHLTQTPPFSPGAEPYSPMLNMMSPGLPPKALPTPPLQPSKRHSVTTSFPTSGNQDRTLSQILRMPQETSTRPAPLSPRRARTNVATEENSDQDKFIQESLRRHQAFLEKERVAASDEDRLRAFSDYILAESRLRRRRYSQAWSSGNFDVRPVRERLFEQTMHLPRRSSGLQESTIASPTEQRSPAVASDPQDRPESAWWNNYQPALSPIASMSNHDDMSSRGRTPSRWWESQSGSEGARKVERSKRETKYMSLPRELQEAMQWGESQARNMAVDASAQDRTTDYPAEKANPETFGIYDDQPSPPEYPRSSLPTSQLSSPTKLDVSRLVTLPPPYPRHYPAVNNSHPDLVSYRTVIRAVSDLEEVTARKKRYKTNMEALRTNSEQKVSENRFAFRANIRAQIEDGSISFAEAAEAEEALKVEENEIEKQRVQAEFDLFQDVVLNPLHDILNERISQADSCLKDLGGQITASAQSPNPNQTQEEGDEQPELLEKLTQLKWLFEGRESNHREVYALLSERNERFKAIVMLPYKQSGNKDKMRDTEAFFARDNHDRRMSFESESLRRHQSFLQVIEDNVARGVELQLSAFWDIAPDLVDVLHGIPEDLKTFEGIEIPNQELEENPSYHKFPLQYLHSLLLHAERSTYQFIESQTNLLCLLHEAKTGVMNAEFKVREVQKSDDALVEDKKADAETASERTDQEKALTLELKEKVSTIEEQWVEALGSKIESTKEKIKSSLVEAGGWDEQAED